MNDINVLEKFINCDIIIKDADKQIINIMILQEEITYACGYMR